MESQYGLQLFLLLLAHIEVGLHGLIVALTDEDRTSSTPRATQLLEGGIVWQGILGEYGFTFGSLNHYGNDVARITESVEA